jgi:hypothetical protein
MPGSMEWDDITSELVEYLGAINLLGEHAIWRESINGVWVIFLEHNKRQWCFVPVVEGGEGKTWYEVRHGSTTKQ